jgi:uncharacterized protein (DUF697 family)
MLIALLSFKAGYVLRLPIYFSYQLSVISCQLSVVSCLLSINGISWVCPTCAFGNFN